MAQALLTMEQKYHNPPRTDEQPTVSALRGAVAVLVVASLESYLRSVIEERLSEMCSKHRTLTFDKLPDKMRVNNVYFCLERAMKGPLYQDRPPKVQRLPDIDRACRLVISGNIDPGIFSDVGSNPNPRNLTAMFSNIALDNILESIKDRFDRKWGKITAHTFVRDKLQEIVSRRHVVAHTADTLKIGRSDLKESIRFIRILVEMIEAELTTHIKTLMKNCI